MGDVLVIGGAGYVGAELTRRLAAQGRRVRVLDRMLFGSEPLDGVRAEVIVGDCCDPATVEAAVEGVEVVYLSAGLVGDSACDIRPDAAKRWNVDSVRTVVDSLAGSGTRLVFLSSGSVYGRDCIVPATEDSAPRPDSVYSRTRLESDELVLGAGSEVVATVLRLGGLFGWSARMRFDLPINNMTARAVVEGTVTVSAAPTLCPYVHVADVVESALLVSSLPADVVAGQVFNVGSEELTVTQLEAAEIVRQVTGARIEVLPGGEGATYAFTFAKLSQLGFRPRWTIADGVRDMARRIADVPDFRAPRFYNSSWVRLVSENE